MLGFIYFGFIYGLYALAFFLPTIIGGFEAQFGTKFGFFEKGLITAIPYLPAAISSVLVQGRHKRGVKTWHIAGPAVVGAVSIPLALFAGSPAADHRGHHRSPPAPSSGRCRTSGPCRPSSSPGPRPPPASP